MKKIFIQCLVALVLASSLSSCATVFGGKITQAQRTPPKAGEPKRAVRAVPLIADIVLFWPGLVVDFITGAIYKPEGNGTVPEQTETKKETVSTVTTTESI
jgi:hypothetical protein